MEINSQKYGNFYDLVVELPVA